MANDHYGMHDDDGFDVWGNEVKSDDTPLVVEATTIDGEMMYALIRGNNTVISDNEAGVRLYAWKQVHRYDADDPGYSEPVRLGSVWHSGPWETGGLCGACGGQIAILTERSGWTVPYCRRGGFHGSLSLEDHRRIARNRRKN